MGDTGLKYDGDKPPVELVPRQLIEAAARALGYGEKKYAAYNWREGIQTRRLMGGILRHLIAFASGERTDPESGLSHLDHAASGLAMLIATIDESLADDDLIKLKKAVEETGGGRTPGWYLRSHTEVKARRPQCYRRTDPQWLNLPSYAPSYTEAAGALGYGFVKEPDAVADYYEEVK